MNTDTIASLTSRIEGELRDILSARQMPLYDMMLHQLALDEPHAGGLNRRSRGVLCLLACEAFGGPDVALPAAAAVGTSRTPSRPLQRRSAVRAPRGNDAAAASAGASFGDGRKALRSRICIPLLLTRRRSST